MTNTLAIVGAGRVGRALGKLLHLAGWRIGAVVAQNIGTAKNPSALSVLAGPPRGSREKSSLRKLSCWPCRTIS